MCRIDSAGPAGIRETLRTTLEHPFWVASHGWVRAAGLRARDSLQTHDGATRRVVSVIQMDNTDTVYNIEVAGGHTFFVGEQGVWVHNKPMRTRGIRISRRWRARKITDPACAQGCEQVARQIQKHIGGKIHRIKGNVDATMKIGRYRGQNMKWYYHKVVVKNGRVYDAFTGYKGLSIADYKKLWQYGDALLFGF